MVFAQLHPCFRTVFCSFLTCPAIQSDGIVVSFTFTILSWFHLHKAEYRGFGFTFETIVVLESPIVVSESLWLTS